RAAGSDERPRIAAEEAARRAVAHGPLVEHALDADVALDVPAAVGVGTPTRVVVRVQNRGVTPWSDGATPGALRVRAGWRHAAGRPFVTLTAPGRVALLASRRAHWRDALEERYRVADAEAPVDGPVAPGETREIVIDTRAPATGARYRLVAAVERVGGV